MYLLQLETEERKLFLELAHLIANSDGIIVEQEEEMLERYRDEMNLSHKEYEIQNLSLDNILAELKDHSLENKRMILLEVLAIAFSDGVYDEEQKQIIKKLKQSFNISVEEYETFKNLLQKVNKIYEEINTLIYA
jgi:tellurite resistance protein